MLHCISQFWWVRYVFFFVYIGDHALLIANCIKSKYKMELFDLKSYVDSGRWNNDIWQMLLSTKIIIGELYSLHDDK